MDLTDDPYAAYCLDEACAYILEQTMRRRAPKFPRTDAKQQPGKRNNTTLVAQMRAANQRYKEAGRM